MLARPIYVYVKLAENGAILQRQRGTQKLNIPGWIHIDDPELKKILGKNPFLFRLIQNEHGTWGVMGIPRVKLTSSLDVFQAPVIAEISVSGVPESMEYVRLTVNAEVVDLPRNEILELEALGDKEQFWKIRVVDKRVHADPSSLIVTAKEPFKNETTNSG